MRDILFDADSVRYAAGFATQKTVHMLPNDTREYKKISQCKEIIKDNNLPADTEITHKVYEEPLENCLQVLKHLMQKPLDAIPHNKYIIALTKGSNFRHDLATIRPYKAGRAAKPVWHKEMFEYQQKHWGGVLIPNLEADDMIGLLHNEGTICVGIDKDLLTVPGTHYNYQKQMMQEVTTEMALRRFYTQLLEGDSSDNIQGLPYCAPSTREKYNLTGASGNGCAKGSANKIISQLRGTERELFSAVRECWLAHRLDSNPDISPDILVQDMEVDLLETGRLLHMTRELHKDGSPKLWEFPSCQ